MYVAWQLPAYCLITTAVAAAVMATPLVSYVLCMGGLTWFKYRTAVSQHGRESDTHGDSASSTTRFQLFQK